MPGNGSVCLGVGISSRAPCRSARPVQVKARLAGRLPQAQPAWLRLLLGILEYTHGTVLFRYRASVNVSSARGLPSVIHRREATARITAHARSDIPPTAYACLLLAQPVGTALSPEDVTAGAYRLCHRHPAQGRTVPSQRGLLSRESILPSHGFSVIRLEPDATIFNNPSRVRQAPASRQTRWRLRGLTSLPVSTWIVQQRKEYARFASWR